MTQVSTFYRNPPLGPPDQPWYVNAVAQVRTRLGPEELLRLLQQLETALGRVRGERWGPRVIDLDLLLYNGEVIFDPGAGAAPPGDAPAGLCPGAPGGDRPRGLAPGAGQERRGPPGRTGPGRPGGAATYSQH